MNRLAVSIVLYQPSMAMLMATLQTLAVAVRHARSTGMLTKARLLLTDHSPRPRPPEMWSNSQAVFDDFVVDYRHDPTNPGYASGHNAAFLRCNDADYFLVSNADVIYSPDAIQAGLQFMSMHAQAGVIVPALADANGARPACFREPDLLALGLRAFGLNAKQSRRIARYEFRDWDIDEPMFNPPALSGCCLLFRRETYARLDGFDPAYFLYFEDFDLARRAAEEGVSAYCPGMRVWHRGGGAVRKGWRHRWWFLRSYWRYRSNAHYLWRP